MLAAAARLVSLACALQAAAADANGKGDKIVMAWIEGDT